MSIPLPNSLLLHPSFLKATLLSSSNPPFPLLYLLLHLWERLPYPLPRLLECFITAVRHGSLYIQQRNITCYSHLGLALSLAGGTASTYFRAGSGSENPRGLSEANINRLVEKLSRMRGAALKLGQFMSIQGIVLICCFFSKPLSNSKSDSHSLPPDLDKVFRRVQNNAHYMPHWQMEVRHVTDGSFPHLAKNIESDEGLFWFRLLVSLPGIRSDPLCCGLHRPSTRSSAK